MTPDGRMCRNGGAGAAGSNTSVAAGKEVDILWQEQKQVWDFTLGLR